MDQIQTLFSALFSIYLPINDMGTRIAVSLALSGLLSGLLKKFLAYFQNIDLWNYFGNNTYLVIDHEHLMYSKILTHIYERHTDKLYSCKLELFNNKMHTTRLKQSAIEEDYVYHGVTHKIKISFDAQKNDDPKDKKKDEIKNDSPNILLSVRGPVNIIESYLISFIQDASNLIANKVPIYRITNISNGKNKSTKWQCSVTKLSKNIKNTIVSDFVEKNFYGDIHNFIHNEQFYLDRGLPYKRGYILHGEPGCGKTSLIKAVANQYKLPIFIIDLNIIHDNNEFIKIMTGINSYIKNDQKYLVIFEDIDRSTMFDKWHRSSGITIDCFLNILDGLDEYYGRITIITTNDFSVVNQTKSLIRPGRIDVVVEITTCTIPQIHAIMKFYFPDYIIEDHVLKAIVITPAQLTQLILTLNDVTKIVTALNKYLNFTSLSLEKINHICYENGNINDPCINVTETITNEKHDRSSYSVRLIKKYNNTLKEKIDQLKMVALKVELQKNTVDSMTKMDKIRYGKLVIQKEILDYDIGNLKQKIAITKHKYNMDDVVDLIATPTVDPIATPTVDLIATPTVDPIVTPTVDPIATPTVDLIESQTVDLIETSSVDTPTVDPIPGIVII